LKLAKVHMNNRNYIWNWLELQWWAYGSNQNQYLDTEELSSTPVSLLILDSVEQIIRMNKIKRKLWSEQLRDANCMCAHVQICYSHIIDSHKRIIYDAKLYCSDIESFSNCGTDMHGSLFPGSCKQQKSTG
jgi:hypothetical protein